MPLTYRNFVTRTPSHGVFDPMERIPPEILSSILGYVESPGKRRLANLSCVSRQWQDAVEYRTFRSLQLSSLDLDTFSKLYQHENIRRRAYLRTVMIRCIMPHRRLGCCVVTDARNREDDSRAWSDFMRQFLSTVNEIASRYKGLADYVIPVRLEFLNNQRGNRNEYPHLFESRMRCTSGELKHSAVTRDASKPRPGSINLDKTGQLPSLPEVTALEVHGWGESKFLNPAWIAQAIRTFSSLRKLELKLEDAYTWGSNWRIQYQDNLKCIFGELPATIKKVRIKVWTQEIMNEDMPLQKLCTLGSGDHIYELALRSLSLLPSLRLLYLTGPLCVSSDLFDRLACDTSRAEIFPLLEEFALEFTPHTADGRWFYLRDKDAFERRKKNEEEDEDEDEDDEETWDVYMENQVRRGVVPRRNRYRSFPDPELFVPFITSGAKVCSKMPRIKKFSMKLNRNNMSWNRLEYDFLDRAFDLWYLAAGKTLDAFNKEIENPVIPPDVSIASQNRVYLRAAGCRLDTKIAKSWKDVVGVKGKILLLDETHCSYSSPWGYMRMQYTAGELHEITL